MAGHSDGAAWRPSPLSCTVEWQKPAAVVARKGENDQGGSAPKPHPPGWGGEVRCCAAGKKGSRIAECKERRKADETGKPIVTTTRKAGGCVHSACTGSALAPGFCLCGGIPVLRAPPTPPAAFRRPPCLPVAQALFSRAMGCAHLRRPPAAFCRPPCLPAAGALLSCSMGCVRHAVRAKPSFFSCFGTSRHALRKTGAVGWLLFAASGH